jgi:hypothetical protein
MDQVIARRLARQRLLGTPSRTPAEAVAWLGAVQSQDYPGAKWAVGQRVRGATDASIEAAFDRGEIVRVHALRPTWHFVVPADLRWIQALTGPRVQRILAVYDRQLGPTPEPSPAPIASSNGRFGITPTRHGPSWRRR